MIRKICIWKSKILFKYFKFNEKHFNTNCVQHSKIQRKIKSEELQNSTIKTHDLEIVLQIIY